MKKCETLFEDFWRAYLMSCVQNANPIVTNFKFINFPHPVIADADNHLWFSGMRRHGHDGYHATRWSPFCPMPLIGTTTPHSTRWVPIDTQDSCRGGCPPNTDHASSWCRAICPTTTPMTPAKKNRGSYFWIRLKKFSNSDVRMFEPVAHVNI